MSYCPAKIALSSKYHRRLGPIGILSCQTGSFHKIPLCKLLVYFPAKQGLSTKYHGRLRSLLAYSPAKLASSTKHHRILWRLLTYSLSKLALAHKIPQKTVEKVNSTQAFNICTNKINPCIQCKTGRYAILWIPVAPMGWTVFNRPLALVAKITSLFVYCSC